MKLRPFLEEACESAFLIGRPGIPRTMPILPDSMNLLSQRHALFILVFVIGAAVTCPTLLSGEYYKFIDENGTIHFVDHKYI